MELGDFGLTSVTGAEGALIRVGQWLNGSGASEYEHAFVYVGDDHIVEAEPGGARLAWLGEYAGRTVATSRVPLTPAQRAAIVAAARAYVGTPYSFLDYVALAAHRLHVPAPGLRAYIRSSGHMICSQLVDQCYANAGVHLFQDDRWAGDVTPGDLTAFI